MSQFLIFDWFCFQGGVERFDKFQDRYDADCQQTGCAVATVADIGQNLDKRDRRASILISQTKTMTSYVFSRRKWLTTISIRVGHGWIDYSSNSNTIEEQHCFGDGMHLAMCHAFFFFFLYAIECFQETCQMIISHHGEGRCFLLTCMDHKDVCVGCSVFVRMN